MTGPPPDFRQWRADFVRPGWGVSATDYQRWLTAFWGAGHVAAELITVESQMPGPFFERERQRERNAYNEEMARLEAEIQYMERQQSERPDLPVDWHRLHRLRVMVAEWKERQAQEAEAMKVAQLQAELRAQRRLEAHERELAKRRGWTV